MCSRVTIIRIQYRFYYISFSEFKNKMRKLFILLTALVLMLVILDGVVSQSRNREIIGGSSSWKNKYTVCVKKCKSRRFWCKKKCAKNFWTKKRKCLRKCDKRYKACRICCWRKYILQDTKILCFFPAI